MEDNFRRYCSSCAFTSLKKCIKCGNPVDMKPSNIVRIPSSEVPFKGSKCVNKNCTNHVHNFDMSNVARYCNNCLTFNTDSYTRAPRDEKSGVISRMGNELGYIFKDSIFDEDGKPIGSIKRDEIYDKWDHLIARYKQNTVYDREGHPVGFFEYGRPKTTEHDFMSLPGDYEGEFTDIQMVAVLVLIFDFMKFSWKFHPKTTGEPKRETVETQAEPKYYSDVARPVEELKNAEPSPKSKTVLIILWFFTGIYGGHHFYAGHTSNGFWYLCTAGFFGIGWCIDLFRVITGNFVDANGKPINRG